MENSMEQLEAICDHIAASIKDVDGDMTSTQVNALVTESLKHTGYVREQLDEMFENIYRCNITNYVDNADWATKSGFYIDDFFLDPDEFEDITPDEFGLSVDIENDN